MYKIIETENQDYIFFPYTLAIFPYDEKVKVAMQCNRNNDLKSDDDLTYMTSWEASRKQKKETLPMNSR